MDSRVHRKKEKKAHNYKMEKKSVFLYLCASQRGTKEREKASQREEKRRRAETFLSQCR